MQCFHQLVKPLLVGSTDTIYQSFLIQLPCNTTLIYAFHYPNQLLKLNLSTGTEVMFTWIKWQQVEQLILNALVFYLNPIIQYRDSLYARPERHCTFLIYNFVLLCHTSVSVNLSLVMRL